MSEPWETEPNEAEWTDSTGLRCVALRHTKFLHWCGYVELPKDWRNDLDDAEELDVHGGVTYFADRLPGKQPNGHLFVGFDCGHIEDFSPGLVFVEPGTVYRDLAFVKNNCHELCEQIVARVGLLRC